MVVNVHENSIAQNRQTVEDLGDLFSVDIRDQTVGPLTVVKVRLPQRLEEYALLKTDAIEKSKKWKKKGQKRRHRVMQGYSHPERENNLPQIRRMANKRIQAPGIEPLLSRQSHIHGEVRT
jgi:hypothetical protein